MDTVVIASNNKHKIEEFKKMLPGFCILSLSDIGFGDDIVEDGKSFLENSLIKAKAVVEFLKKQNKSAVVIADDSGLCVASLNGEPGIYSARYSGDHNDKSNRAKLLERLEGKADRSAYFVCLLVVMKMDGSYKYVEGKTFGNITDKELGKTDFGYDCIFYCDELKKTFGQASEDEKNSASHRGRAIRLLFEKGLLK